MMEVETMQALAAQAASISDLQQRIDHLERRMEHVREKLGMEVEQQPGPPTPQYYNEVPQGGPPMEE